MADSKLNKIIIVQEGMSEGGGTEAKQAIRWLLNTTKQQSGAVGSINLIKLLILFCLTDTVSSPTHEIQLIR